MLHLTFDNCEFRDLGHSDFWSYKVLAPTLKNTSDSKKHCHTYTNPTPVSYTFSHSAQPVRIVIASETYINCNPRS